MKKSLRWGSLVLSFSLVMGACVALAADRTWTGLGGDSLWSNPANWSDNTVPSGNGDQAIFPAEGVIGCTVDTSRSIKCIYFRNPGMTLTVAAGANLHFDNSGALTMRAEENATINGDGTLTFSVNTGENFADNQAATGKTLTILAKITGANGFEHNGTGGTIVLGNNANDQVGNTLITAAGAVSVATVANAGIACPLGTGAAFKFSNGPATFRYTGTGGSTDRTFNQNAGAGLDAIVEHAGSGTLTLSGPFFSGNDNAHAFVFNVINVGATIENTGLISNGGTGALGLTKRGAGTQLLSTTNTYTGSTVVEQGTLGLTPSGAISSSSTLQMRGGNLLLNAGTPAAAYTAALGTLQVNGAGSVVSIAPGATSAEVTFASITYLSGSVDFSAAGLGTTTKIFITGQADGLIGPWATVNGGSARATYSSSVGIYAADLSVQALLALGPSSITNNPNSIARITGIGTSGGITLASDPTAVGELSQAVNTSAVVSLSGKTFVAPYLQIASGGADLTLGSVRDDGTLMAPSDVLLLGNANPAGGPALLVNAAVTNNGATALRVSKLGPGKVILAGPVTHTGGTAISDGTLVIDTASAALRTLPSGVISGNGGLTLTGTGTVAFPNVANTYAGTTTVAGGTARILNNATFGSTAAPTIVQDGAAIDFWGTAGNSLRIGNEQLSAQGAGPDGFGALQNTGPLDQFWAMSHLTLTGPLTIGADKRLDVRGDNAASTFVNLNGYGITKKGVGQFGFTQTTVTNDQGTSFIDITAGSLTIEENATLSGGASNHIDVRGGAYFDFYNIRNPINWALNLDNNARVYTRQGNATNLNVIAGPIHLGGSVTFDSGGVFADTYTGAISGTGPLLKTGNEHGITYLRNTNNAWSGGTTVSGGILYAAAPATLPGYATSVTVDNTGCLALRVADAAATKPGFSLSQIESLIGNDTFQSPISAIGLDTAYENLNYTGDLPDIGIRKFGPNTLTLSGSGANLGPIRVYGGILDLSPADRYLDDQSIVVGVNSATAGSLAGLVVTNNAQITTLDKGYNISGQPQVIIGDSTRGAMLLSDDAKVAARLVVGGAASGAGAVYQTGGTMHNTGGAGNDGRIGASGYGYYLLAGGSCTNNGYSQIGQAPTGVGILEQTGGSFAFNNSYAGNYGISRGGIGVAHLAGGHFLSTVTLWVGDQNESGTSGGQATLTVTDSADVTINAPIDLGNRDNMTAMLNLKGGELNAARVYRANRTGTDALINWNGGLFRVNGTGDTELFNGGIAELYPDVTLYAGGAFIDLPASTMTRSISTPLRKPQGMGLISIPVATAGSGYIGSPLVSITGGSGKGASAYAHMDPISGTVTSIEIVSPGTGYTHAPTVTLVGGGATTAATLGTPVLGLSASGGLTKLGEGRLTLNADNTYTGTTEVQAGTLRLGRATALSPLSALNVTGGTLDLGGYTISNHTVTATSGSIFNGTLATAALDKDGPGTFELGAPLAVNNARAQPALIPGLWEGMVRSAWDTTTPNPKTGIQLTTRAAIGSQASNGTYANGLWAGNNHTWIYTGYIWNRATTNETWSFRGRFDDHVSLALDGSTIIDTGNAGTIVANVTMTPGPHAIEMRFGDGAGDVGPAGEPFGIAFDPLGRASASSADYRQLLDPGDGSLLTIDIPELRGPGLVESVIRQAWNTTDAGQPVSRQLTTRAGNGAKTANGTYAGGLWSGNNHTWIYKGVIWNRGESDVTWRWRFTFDDNVRLMIDGVVVRDVGLGEGIVYQDHTLTPGPHSIEIRFGDGGGDVGPANGLGGLTYSTNLGSTDPNDYILLQDPGDGSLLTTDLESGLPLPENTVVNINEGTLRVAAPAIGLWEGRIAARWDTTSVNPATAVELTTTAANGWCNENESINGKPWPNDSTYVYSGYIWNRTGADVTWTFGENFDDQVLLRIDGVTVLDDGGWNTPTIGTVTLTPGPHAFDLRLGQGGGGAGAPSAVTGWWNTNARSFAVDFQGRHTENMEFFEVPTDPGDGSLFTRTSVDPMDTQGPLVNAIVNLADGAVLDLNGSECTVNELIGSGIVSNGTLSAGTVISPAGDAAIGTQTLADVLLDAGVTYRVTVNGALSDRITSSAALNLSGVTIVPATAAALTERTYVVAHAEGGFSGAKPTVSGFPSKYKIIIKGKDMLLTSEFGSVMIIR